MTATTAFIKADLADAKASFYALVAEYLRTRAIKMLTIKDDENGSQGHEYPIGK